MYHFFFIHSSLDGHIPKLLCFLKAPNSNCNHEWEPYCGKDGLKVMPTEAEVGWNPCFLTQKLCSFRHSILEASCPFHQWLGTCWDCPSATREASALEKMFMIYAHENQSPLAPKDGQLNSRVTYKSFFISLESVHFFYLPPNLPSTNHCPLLPGWPWSPVTGLSPAPVLPPSITLSKAKVP